MVLGWGFLLRPSSGLSPDKDSLKGPLQNLTAGRRCTRGARSLHPCIPDPTGMGHSDDSPAMARVGVGMQSWDGVLVKVTFQRGVAVGEGRLRNAEKEEVLCPATGPRKTE